MNDNIQKTRRAWDQPGHAHFITYSCYPRLPLLTRPRSHRWVVDALDAARVSHHLALWAYVVMPEHVHVLLRPLDARYAMRRILAAIKRPVSDAARGYLESIEDERWLARLSVEYPSRRVFRFWQQGGGYDRNVIQERSVPDIIEYIHLNPVRRGLVERATDWEWSSARFWAGEPGTHLSMDHPSG